MSTVDNKNLHSFEVHCEGESTGERYDGIFKAKKILSHRDRMVRDQLMAKHCGGSVQSATDAMYTDALVLSELAVRIVEAPLWWTASNGGYDLQDSTPLSEIYAQAMEEQFRVNARVEEKAKADQLKIKAALAEKEKLDQVTK